MKCEFIVLLSIIFKHYFCKIITIPYYKEQYGYSIFLMMGARSEHINFKLDMTLNETNINNNVSEKELKSKKEYLPSLFSGEVIIPFLEPSGRIYVQAKINSFYYFLNKNSNIQKNVLGLGFHFEDKNLSLINRLYEKKVIDEFSFGFYHTIKNENSFFIGGFPKDLTNNKTIVNLQVNEKNKNWGCKLNKIIINEYQYFNDDYSFFHTNIHYVLVPVKFHRFLNDLFFSDALQKKTCFYVKEDNNLRCQCEEFEKIEKFYFVFGKVGIAFNNFYEKEKVNQCKLLLLRNHNNKNHWEIGIPFLEQYLVKFSYSENSIFFYGDNNKFIVEDINIVIILFDLIIVLQLINISLLLLISIQK